MTLFYWNKLNWLCCVCVCIQGVLAERAYTTTTMCLGPPLSRSEAAKRPGGLPLAGWGVMDGGGGEGRAWVPPTSRFTIIKRKKKETRKQEEEVENLFFFFFFFSECYIQQNIYICRAALCRGGGAVTDSPHSFQLRRSLHAATPHGWSSFPFFFFLILFPSIFFSSSSSSPLFLLTYPTFLLLLLRL